MKNIVGWLAFALAGFAASAYGQNFNPASGYSAQALFSVNTGSPSLGISSMGAGNGAIYYLETNNFGGSTETHLRAYSLASGTSSDLYDYNAIVSGTVIKTSGSTVYFGASQDFTNYSLLSYNTATSQSATIAASIAGLYDLAVSGNTAYVSANPSSSSAANQVYRLNLSTGALTSVVNTGGDYSGPIMLDAAGNLYYGATSLSATGDLYRFTAAQVANAFTNNTPLTLANGVDLYNLSGSQYLALGAGNDIYQSLSPFGGAATVSQLSTAGSLLQSIGTTGNGDFISGLAYLDSALYVSVTSSSNDTTIFRVVPEPTVAWLFLASVGLCGLRRNRVRL